MKQFLLKMILRIAAITFGGQKNIFVLLNRHPLFTKYNSLISLLCIYSQKNIIITHIQVLKLHISQSQQLTWGLSVRFTLMEQARWDIPWGHLSPPHLRPSVRPDQIPFKSMRRFTLVEAPSLVGLGAKMALRKNTLLFWMDRLSTLQQGSTIHRVRDRKLGAKRT